MWGERDLEHSCTEKEARVSKWIAGVNIYSDTKAV